MSLIFIVLGSIDDHGEKNIRYMASLAIGTTIMINIISSVSIINKSFNINTIKGPSIIFNI